MDIERAKELLKSLAEGVDPLTGEVLPEDHVCNQPELIRALYCVLGKLDEPKAKPKKTQAENAGKPWTTEDDARLCQMFDAGATKRELCERFQRSEGAIESRLARLGKIDRKLFSSGGGSII